MANKLFIFEGPRASGKKTIVTQLISMGLHNIPVYSTRQFKEKDGLAKDLYKSISRDDFMKQDFLVKTAYKGDYFGVYKKDVQDAMDTRKISLLIMDANGIKQIGKLIKQNVFTIYLMTDYVALVDRMLRMGLRNDEIKYHIEYAETNGEFENFKSANYVVKNTGQVNAALEQVLAVMGLMTLPPDEEFKALI